MPSMPLDRWLRALTTQELQDRMEMFGWDRADLEDEKASRRDLYETHRDYLDAMMESFDGELARREAQRKRYGVNRGVNPTMIGKDRYEAAKRSVPISLLLFEYGVPEGRAAGNRVVLRCPLDIHTDSSPSFTVYPGDDGWYCFGCHQGGTVIDLAMQLEKSNDPRHALAVVEKIAAYHGGTAQRVEQLLTR